ncbi:MAG: hypothetical protein ACTSVM_01505 [Candidatus Ranarchaeia archaeon]
MKEDKIGEVRANWVTLEGSSPGKLILMDHHLIFKRGRIRHKETIWSIELDRVTQVKAKDSHIFVFIDDDEASHFVLGHKNFARDFAHWITFHKNWLKKKKDAS